MRGGASRLQRLSNNISERFKTGERERKLYLCFFSFAAALALKQKTGEKMTYVSGSTSRWHQNVKAETG